MPSNWINHSILSTPKIKTSEDIANVPQSRIDEFYQRTHAQLLYCSGRSGGGLPAEIEERLCGCAPRDVSGILQAALLAGSVMDSGWLDDYNDIAEAISVHMQGYPKEYLAQQRALSDAAVGRRSTNDPMNNKGRTNSASKSTSDMPTKTFPFLSLPEEIRNSIYQLTLTEEPLMVSDWAIGSLPSTMLRRTEYDVPISSTGDTRRTSYVVLSPQHPRLGGELSLLLANKQVCREASKILYDREFQFRGTADSTLAFLHDHFGKLKMISRISMQYTTGDKIPFMGCVAVSSSPTPPLTPRTSLQAWKKIFNILVKTAEALQDFELVVDKHFWDQAPWRESPAAVFNDAELCRPRRLPKRSENTENFLQHVAKLAGVNFRLSIAGVNEDQARKVFQRELERYMWDKMHKNPYLAGEKISCTCRKRLLTEACAWGGDSKRRRSG
ncbi:hypothetical protein AOQ84DRAFT_188786 [Glonium stellatum]|uniref:DUF7730 domain-containing protein n=1 Tax=Glonium stellatum TaxID=574774 RepID=A0A8E2F7N2_9PEZI|nr:hypothetical protein AOQ84DRAFT_188786 [Glonium stellatum]